jgi:hypothetical protein
MPLKETQRAYGISQLCVSGEERAFSGAVPDGEVGTDEDTWKWDDWVYFLSQVCVRNLSSQLENLVQSCVGRRRSSSSWRIA